MGCASSTAVDKSGRRYQKPRSDSVTDSFATSASVSLTASVVSEAPSSASTSSQRTILTPETMSPHNYDGARHRNNARHRGKASTKRTSLSSLSAGAWRTTS